MTLLKHLFFLTLAITTFLNIQSAHATLGEPESSIENVRRYAGATRRPGVRRAVGTSSYTVHELNSAGTTIREYVSPDGTVFAVSWQGYRTPDTKTLIGSYDSELQSLSRRAPRHRGLRSQHLASNKLVAIRGGHPRALRGRYIAPALLPAGVNANDIQ